MKRCNDTQVLEERFGDYIHLIKNDKHYGGCAANNMAIRYALNSYNPDYLLLHEGMVIVDLDSNVVELI